MTAHLEAARILFVDVERWRTVPVVITGRRVQQFAVFARPCAERGHAELRCKQASRTAVVSSAKGHVDSSTILCCAAVYLHLAVRRLLLEMSRCAGRRHWQSGVGAHGALPGAGAYHI